MANNFKIVYEDDDILAVLKPAGIVVHQDSHHKGNTLIDEILRQYPQIKNVGDPSASSRQENLRPGIVHRLDKDTSGILLIAKNQRSFLFFKKAFQEKKIEKRYFALVVGIVKKEKGVIDLPIGRGYKEPTLRVSRGKMRGTIREALTEYRVKKRFPEYTLLELIPKTGRTHQIRSHLSAIGHPVICDKLYSGKRFVCPFGLARQFLHAFSLEFRAPSGARLRLEAELPEDLKKVLEGLQKEERNVIKTY